MLRHLCSSRSGKRKDLLLMINKMYVRPMLEIICVLFFRFGGSGGKKHLLCVKRGVGPPVGPCILGGILSPGPH